MYPFERKLAIRRRYIRLRLRSGIATADAIADRLQVSVRTVYRDVNALRRAGCRIDGAAGFGFMLREPSP